MFFAISTLTLLTISFLMALRSLRHDLDKITKNKEPRELKHGIEVFVERNIK